MQLDKAVDLWLSYTWSNNNHGICGHTFEVIDYFHILKDHFSVGILLCEDITWDTMRAAITNKYSFTEDEIEYIRSRTVFHNRPRLVRGRNILFVDGGVINTSSVALYFDNILYFACGNKEIRNNEKSNVYILQDDRIYDPVKVNGIDYKKRILFDKLKPIGESEDRMLVYATANCRQFTNYRELDQYNQKILAVVNTLPNYQCDEIEFVIPPVADIFSRFTTYLYTPVPRKFDCSPRFIAECAYYGKHVIYHNIDYWDEDRGLFWRKWDIDHSFDSLYLRPTDEIVSIIRNIIC